MNLLDPHLTEYLAGLARHGNPVLEQMEARAEATKFPILGPVAAQFCYLIARIQGARRIFELGSGYGYSTYWFARAIAENGGGTVYHTVWDADLSRDAQAYLSGLGVADLVQFRVGEAVASLRETPGPFDLILNDVDKDGYPASLPIIKERLRPGGVLIIDNVLWSGRIFDDADRRPSTEGIREVTRLVFEDPDFAASIVPIRDGLLVAYRR